MNKKLIFLNILLVIGVLLAACGNYSGTMPSKNQSSGMHEISAVIQATEEPPIAFPTIVINPTPGSGGSFPIDPTTLLLYILVGAVILIALIAVMKR